MKGKYLLAVIILTYVLSLSVSIGDLQPIFLPSTTSTSPLNPYPFGTYSFYTDLVEWYDVGFVNSPLEIDLEGDKLLYIVLGPDEPFTGEEAKYVYELLEKGTIDLLVADETNISNTLLAFIGIEIDGRILAEAGVVDESRFLSGVDCGELGSGFISKSSYINTSPENSLNLCLGSSRYVVGVNLLSTPTIGILLKFDSGSKAVVIADSSICANFMYSPSWWNEVGNKPLCLSIIDYITEGEYGKIVFDVGHYKGNQVFAPVFADYLIKGIIVLQIIVGVVLDLMGPFLFPFLILVSLLTVASYVDVFKVGYREVEDPIMNTLVMRILRENMGKLNLFERHIGIRFKMFRRIIIDRLLKDYS